MPMSPRAIAESLTELWSPRVIGELDDSYVKVAKLQGTFGWHAHAHEDELFFILEGRLRIEMETDAVEIGEGEMVDPTPENAIVRIVPREGGVRPVDRTIVEVAAANDGRYTIDAHLQQDPSASEGFAETHVRRLEAMRKIARNVERDPDGSWIVTPDHLDKVVRFEARQLHDRPVAIEALSTVPLDNLPAAEAATDCSAWPAV